MPEPATLNLGTGRLWSIREALSMSTGHAIEVKIPPRGARAIGQG